jgi:ribosomal protein L40E
MRFIRPYAGFAFSGRGIRPYCGLRLSLTQPKHTTNKQFKILYHCSHCNAINGKDAHYCSRCGAKFQ